MSVVIDESGMHFGEYEDNQVFQIEKSPQYRENLLPNGIKSCEFILIKGKKLYFIEAKTSCPNQITADSSEEKISKYQSYINDITLKMRHSLELYSNILLNRYSYDGVPELLRKTDLSGVEVRLVLVVKTAEERWLEPFVDVFNKTLHDEMRIWKIQRIYVINEEQAQKKGLILAG